MFRSLSVLSVSILSLTLSAGSAAAATAWPSTSTGTNIGGALPSGFEPSGIVWDNPSGYLWVVDDEGKIARMQRNGAGTTVWTIQSGLDLESIAVTGTTFKLYLGVEYPPQILEYNTSTTSAAPTPTGKNWYLTSLPADSSNGMEGLTWVPNGYHPYANTASGGVFYASSQQNGKIYVYDVDLAHGSTAPVLLDSFTPDSSQTDISDLFYSTDTQTLFVLYDSANRLREVSTSTTLYPTLKNWVLPAGTSGQEGVTLLPQCPGTLTDIFIADDDGASAHNVYSFNNFPQACKPAP